MELKFFTVDAFATKPFHGNPAAVVFVTKEVEDAVDKKMMQNIAAEVNLSETAFLFGESETSFASEARFDIRWFTPTVEVPLCGHATLASMASLILAGNQCRIIEFSTQQSGVIKAFRNGNISDASDRMPQMSAATASKTFATATTMTTKAITTEELPSITLDFPLNSPKRVEEYKWNEIGQGEGGITEGRGGGGGGGGEGRGRRRGDEEAPEIRDIITSIFGKYHPPLAGVYQTASGLTLLLHLKTSSASLAILQSLNPDFETLETLVKEGIRGVIVTVAANRNDQGNHDFYSRFFSPWNGVKEDPVCGSIHTVLG